MTKKITVSVVVPVYNEEKNIHAVYTAVTALFQTQKHVYYEIVFTDNCSEDSTFSLLEDICKNDHHVRAFRFSKNMGYQLSILEGYKQCVGDVAVQLDADLQDPPELIPKMLEKWREGYAVVYGIRKSRKEIFYLEWARKIFYRLLHRLSGQAIPVDAGDFRLIDRKVINVLREIQSTSPYIRGIIANIGFRQIGVPYDRADRKHGTSKFGFKALFSFAIDAFANHSIAPLRIPFYVSLLIFVISIALMAAYALSKLYLGVQWPAGFTTIVCLLLVSIAINTFFMGMIGEYVGRLFHHVNSPEKVIIDKELNSPLK